MARLDFGLSADEFWGMTPREFGALINRIERRNRAQSGQPEPENLVRPASEIESELRRAVSAVKKRNGF